MTDWKISALGDEIDRLRTAVSELTRAISSADRRLESLCDKTEALRDKIGDFWSDFWFWAFPLLPLGFLLFLMIKHW